MTYHADMFDIELQDENGVLYEEAPFQGMTLPFRPCVGDVIMIRNAGAPEFEVLKVSYFNGQLDRLIGKCEFVGFLLTVRKLSP
jgi:hypothetical protein